MPPISTHITALLDAHGIHYRRLPHAASALTVDEAAKQRGVVKEEMVKSILLRDRDGHFVMACVTGDAQLDPKAVRAQLPDEWKRLSFASAEEILRITGSMQGAVAPLGLPENVPVFFDEAILRCPKVSISSGEPMAGLELDPHDLARLAGATLAPLRKT
jgi:Cys-tRNA(Pro)/Cys-tRNA(Cys) deacylase